MIVVKAKPKIKKDNISVINDSISEYSEEIIEQTNDMNINYDENDIITLVNMLGKNRYEYSSWINIGMCLYNLNDKYLYIWDEWSKNHFKYKDGECDKKWNSFNKKNNGLNVGSLVMWVKKDNPEEYKKFINQQTIKKVVQNNKQLFPKNELKIDKIISNDTLHHIVLKDRYCPMYKNYLLMRSHLYIFLYLYYLCLFHI
jgi:hypothetical protein